MLFLSIFDLKGNEHQKMYSHQIYETNNGATLEIQFMPPKCWHRCKYKYKQCTRLICYSSSPNVCAQVWFYAVFHGCISLIDDIVHVHWNRKCLFSNVVIKKKLERTIMVMKLGCRNAKMFATVIVAVVLKVQAQNFIAH